MKYQVTIFSEKYRPISTIVTPRHNETKEQCKVLGIQAICLKKLWGKRELIQYEYKKVKIREVE